MRNKKRAAWIVVCIGCVSGFEGLRQYAYRDPVGIPTVCFGETRGVKMGQRHTVDECKAMLEIRLDEFNDGVNRCLRVPVSDKRRAAIVSFAYNVGTGTFCKSTFVKKLNAGDPRACDELLKYNKAKLGGVYVTLPGLTRRRKEERALCMEG